MKLRKFVALLLVLALCAACASALAATEADARALMESCGVGGPVSDSDNKMGMSLDEVRFDDDGDVYIHWAFSNDIMKNNKGVAFMKICFFDPADLASLYTVYTPNEDGTVSLSWKAGDFIGVYDFVHVIKNDFNPESGVFFMYFNGSGDGAPEEFYTVPQVFTIYIDEDGPHAVENTPRLAPESMNETFANK